MRSNSLFIFILGLSLLPLGCVEKSTISGGIQGSFINIDTTSRGPDIPLYTENQTWRGSAWRGERISIQLLVWSPEEIQNVNISVSDLTNHEHNMIGADQLHLYNIRYVMTDVFAEGCEKTGILQYDSSLVADQLLPFKTPLELTGSIPQWVWISINIPRNAAPGDYAGTLTVSQGQRKGTEFEIEIEVMSPVLPPPDQWSFHLDLWQNPYAEARHHEVEPWTKEHFECMKPTLEMLADAGQKCITTTITDLPWNGQTFDPFHSMVSKVRKRDGSWTYDYTLFDSWVEFAMECGIKDQINCYSMVSWSNKYSYFDELSGRDTSLFCKPGSKDYNQIWSPFLNDFYRHLKEKNWADITTISMDERSLEDLKEVLKLINRESPGLKIAFAGNYHPELDDKLYDLSVASQHILPDENLLRRSNSGLKTTFYVCCVEEKPNTFTFSNPAEATFLPWYAAYRHFDGMLRWSFNSWTPDPLKDSRFRRFPAGDTYMVYPGGVSSVRFERLREGIQDYEKIWILRNHLQVVDSDASNEKLLLLNSHLATFDMENLNHHRASELVSKGKRLLEQLSE